MSSKRNDKFANPTVWQNLDFKTVKQRLNRITDRLEEVLPSSSQIEISGWLDPEDHTKLRQFMKANNLTESQAIGTIVNIFFREK
jgi:hypothetical protein